MADKTIRGPFGVEKGITSDNVGTVASGSSVVEYGDGVFHQTVITVDTTLATIASGNHGYGKKVYTFPGSALDIKATYISMALTASETNITTDTPDIGVGTTDATGGTSTTLNAGTEENIMPGQTADDCNGTAEVKHSVTSLVITTGGAIYFNAAANWSGTEAACAITGTIIINWTFLV